MRATVRSAAVLLATAAVALGAPPLHAGPLTWSLVHDQTVVSTSSQSLTRSLRGLALSNDDANLYAGFIQKSSGSGVQHFTLAGDPPVGTAGAFFNVTGISPSGTDHQPKAVATDDRGLVYVGSSKDGTSGDNARIIVKNATLDAAPQTVIALADIASPGSTTGETAGGLSVRRDSSSGDLQLYVSREDSGSAWVERYVIGGTGAGDATLTLDTSFNGTGRYSIRTDGGFPAASDLRGLEVDEDGNVYVTSRADNAVYRIAADLSGVTVQTVSLAIDLALFDGRVFVTSYDDANSAIFELTASMTLDILGSFDAFSAFPRVSPEGEVDGTGYSGIDIDASGRIFLSDQFYFRDSSEARDRVLVSSALMRLSAVPAPEAGTLSLLLGGLALAGLAARRRVGT